MLGNECPLLEKRERKSDCKQPERERKYSGNLMHTHSLDTCLVLFFPFSFATSSSSLLLRFTGRQERKPRASTAKSE